MIQNSASGRLKNGNRRRWRTKAKRKMQRNQRRRDKDMDKRRYQMRWRSMCWFAVWRRRIIISSMHATFEAGEERSPSMNSNCNNNKNNKKFIRKWKRSRNLNDYLFEILLTIFTSEFELLGSSKFNSLFFDAFVCFRNLYIYLELTL